ncbi:hypothetical protein V6Z05_20040 [Leptospira venezuelensis]|uniref:hypothetical protein n=1 Tax=Leptospira venezuelensis TaxID=1958811 RepID=UPI000A3B239C|nr:hypothetical protein [Leptospira venezuelensis]
MKIIKQLFREFTFPLILSLFWAFYNVSGAAPNQSWTLKAFINMFAPAFFLISWMTGQIFRIKKQVGVESSFEVVQSKLTTLANNIEQKSNEMIDHISGGKSFPMIQIGSINNLSNMGILTVIHNGKHPLYDVHVRIVDLQKFETIKDNLNLANMGYPDTNIPLGNMIPTHASMVGAWNIEHDPEQAYNIFMTARNGSFTQMLRLKKIEGKWVSATRVKNSDNEILYERIDADYPLESSRSVFE